MAELLADTARAAAQTLHGSRSVHIHECVDSDEPCQYCRHDALLMVKVAAPILLAQATAEAAALRHALELAIDEYISLAHRENTGYAAALVDELRAPLSTGAGRALADRLARLEAVAAIAHDLLADIPPGDPRETPDTRQLAQALAAVDALDRERLGHGTAGRR